MQHKDRIALEQILLVIEEADEISKNLSKEEFLEKSLYKMAIIRVGELVKHLTDELRKQDSHIAWRDIAGFRDIVAHKYEILDFERVYISIKDEFPELKLQIEKILETD